VNRRGERFVSEYDYNIGEALDARDPATGEPLHLPAWVIADARILRRLAFRWYASYQPDWARKAPTLGELARNARLLADALAATGGRFNRFAAAGRDEDFHRGERVWEHYKVRDGGVVTDAAAGSTLRPIERPPFVAIPLNRSLLGTKGGPRTNARGEVLRQDG